MTPRIINVLYWLCTLVFSGLMIYTSVGGIKPNEQNIEILHKALGYPVYFIQFISWAKIAGAIAILIPGLYKIKEWAYAGLFFDLAGAVFSGVAAFGKFDPLMLTMLIWIIPGILSYIVWNKKMKLELQ